MRNKFAPGKKGGGEMNTILKLIPIIMQIIFTISGHLINNGK